MKLNNLLSRLGLTRAQNPPPVGTTNGGQAGSAGAPSNPVDSATIGKTDPLEQTMRDDKKLRDMSRRSDSGNLTITTDGGLGINVGGGLSLDLSSGNLGVGIGGF